MAEDFLTREALAKILGLTPARISQLKKEHADFPFRMQGRTIRFPTTQCVTWYTEWKAAEAERRGAAPKQNQLEESERRKALADAEIAEAKAAIAKGDAIPKVDALREFTLYQDRVRAVILALAGRHADERLIGLTSVAQVHTQLKRIGIELLGDLQADAEEYAAAAEEPASDDDDDQEEETHRA
jgi:hypothetical protein